MDPVLAAGGPAGAWEAQQLQQGEMQPTHYPAYPGMQVGMGDCGEPFMCDIPLLELMNANGRKHVPSDLEGIGNWRVQHPQQQAGLSHGLSLHLRDGLRKGRDTGAVPFVSDTPEFVDQVEMMTRNMSVEADCVPLPFQYGMLSDGPSDPWARQDLGIDFRHDECANDIAEQSRYQAAQDKHHLAQSSVCSQYQHASLNEPFICAKPRFDPTIQPVAECQPPVHAQTDLSRNMSISSMCEPELGHNEMNRMSNLSEMNCHRENFSLDLDMCDHSACDPLDSVLERLKEESQYRNDTSILLGEPDEWHGRLTAKDLHRPPVRPLDLCLPEIKHEDWPENYPLGIHGGLYHCKHKSGPTNTPNTKISFSEGESSSDQSCVTIKHEPRDSPKTPNSACPLLKDITQKSRLKTSEYTGVSKHKKSGRWEVHIWLSDLGRQVYLGGYDDVVAAAEAYDIVQLRSRGLDAKTNFPLSKYKRRLENVMSLSLEELISDVRRSSKGFSRGVSNYRGVTKNPNGRWEARIGAYGSRHVYLGLYSHEKEAAIHYDRALVRLRGQKSATNFPLGDYKDALEQHMRISQELGNISVVSLGRIPIVKPHFELFLKFGGRETDSLIAAVKRMDGRTHSVLPKKNARQKMGCRPRCFRDCAHSTLHGNTSASGGDDS